MTTYAMIDVHNGYLWGIRAASDPVTACRTLDDDIGFLDSREPTYTEHPPHVGQGGQSGYYVYVADEIPPEIRDDLVAEDYAAVEELECVAFVARHTN